MDLALECWKSKISYNVKYFDIIFYRLPVSLKFDCTNVYNLILNKIKQATYL